MTRCKCGSDLFPDPFAGINATREDIICPHCDGGGPVTFRCSNCDTLIEGKEPVRHPTFTDEAFCSDSCRTALDEWSKRQAEDRIIDAGIEQARKDGMLR